MFCVMDTNDMSYIKCGEILKSPKNQYILKCFECEDHYYLLENFQFPCEHWTEKCDEDESENQLLDAIYSGVEDDANQEHKYLVEDADKCEEVTDDNSSLDPLNCAEEKNISINEEVVLKNEPLSESECELFVENRKYHVHIEKLNPDKDVKLNPDKDCLETEENFVQSFMKSKENVIMLIEAYKKQPYLWNKNLPQFKLKTQRKICLENIRIELKEHSNLQITCVQIMDVILFITSKYNEHLKDISNNKLYEKTPDDNPTTMWFFRHLVFLQADTEPVPIIASKSPQPDRSPQQIKKMLAIYEKFPHLWNSNLVEHCCQNKRSEALQQMLKVVHAEVNMKFNQNTLKAHLDFIHEMFSKEKRRIQNPNSKLKKKCQYYEKMLFLNDHVGPFKCSECSAELKNPLTFKIHQTKHDGVQHLKCNLCEKEFNTTNAYICHARKHMDDLPEECKECGKRFINPCELGIHMRFHTGAKPYCCEICGDSFRHVQTFIIHKRKHNKKYIHSCPICSKGFYTKSRMDDHVRSHKNIRKFECETCGKAFVTKKTLNQHQVVHEDVRNHACKLCGKTFKLKVGVYQHMKTHGSQISEKSENNS